MSTEIGAAKPLRIPEPLLREVYLHARAAFPYECCGWLTGRRGGDAVDRIRRAHNAYAPDAHPTASDRTAETAYVIEGEELLELDRSIDSDQPARIIYHSHPNGRAYFSETDRRVALDPWGAGPLYPVQQLVVGITAERVVEAKLFGWSPEEGAFVELAALPGAQL